MIVLDCDDFGGSGTMIPAVLHLVALALAITLFVFA